MAFTQTPTAAAVRRCALLAHRTQVFQTPSVRFLSSALASTAQAESSQGNDREFLLEGLTILKNRGHDSAGLATVPSDGNCMVVTKHASDGDKADGIDLVATHSTASTGHTTGIAHTRWATHGGKTDENAHPHVDSSGKIALVHNGTLNNSDDLRRELQALGHEFEGQTDTKVIAKLVGHYYEQDKCCVKEATEKAVMGIVHLAQHSFEAKM